VNGHHGYPVLWLIGAITSLLTAVYMFRLVYLTFHGERRTAAYGLEHPGEEEHGAHGAHAHAPHEPPPSMAVPLIVLAIGSVVAGYIGVPHALGGSNWIEQFLHPSFEVAATAHVSAAATEPAAAGVQTVAFQAAEAAPAESHADVQTERLLMGISTGIALAGIGIAWFFWRRRTDLPVSMARSYAGVYQLLLNKYYVDEIYDAVIVQPIKLISTGVLWKGVDAVLIDGTVNGVGAVVSAGSNTLRRLQTGSIRTYSASLFLGAVLILGWYLWS
jgi:NADH-quinone oxidoreductase subunit L